MSWTSVSKLRNHVLGEPLVDWLDRYGAASGHVKDQDRPEYMAEAQLELYIAKKGNEFEKFVCELIASWMPITYIEEASTNTDEAYSTTLEAMEAKTPAIYQGLLRDESRKMFGIPDFLMLGSAIEKICPGTLGDLDANDYYVVDVKYKGLGVNKNGDLAAKHKWDKAQLATYELLLARTLGRVPTKSFLIGRGVGGGDGDGSNCFSQLRWVKPPDEALFVLIDGGLAWLDRLAKEGSGWTPGIAPLPIEAPGQNDGDWHEAKKELFEKACPVSQDEDLLVPLAFAEGREHWGECNGLEFFVDYETLNSLNDDFTKLPDPNGKSRIFMIGCGHEEKGEFQFTVWTCNDESLEEERRVIHSWLYHMEQVRQRLAPSASGP